MGFKKPFVAASVAVYARPVGKILTIQRCTEPFKGNYAFPGGYLNVDHEDLPATAIRELREETGLVIAASSLQLVDVRSDPRRDPRGHVIDVGYLCVLDHFPADTIVTTEARPLWVTSEEADTLGFAFDHEQFWHHVRVRLHAIMDEPKNPLRSVT